METRRLGRTDLEISVLSIGGLYTSSLAEVRQQQLLAYYELLDQAGMPAFEMCLRFVLSNPAVQVGKLKLEND